MKQLDKSKVRITEKAANPDQITQQLIKDPARLSGFVRQSTKREARLLEAKNNRRRAIEEHRNKSRRQDAEERKSIALGIANCLIEKNPALSRRGKTSELSRLIREQWPRRLNEGPPTTRHIRRWLTGK
jgi:hypothetical protein